MENFENENKKERQLDNLINLVENHTRTERHLEQYSQIGDKENKENARDKQELREKQIIELKEQIKGERDTSSVEEQIQDLKEKYDSTEGYIENNKDNMNEEELENIKERQENRRIQLENLEDNQ